jgi:N-acetyl-gamma-glutamyl-phosphate reductase
MIKVGIVGASGYTGAELIRILAGHSNVELTVLTANKYANRKVASLYPHLGVCGDLEFVAYEKPLMQRKDVVFIAMPHGLSMEVVPDLIGTDAKVIDLSGDFRLKDAGVYEKWYGIPHTQGTLVGRAVYGLPELNRRAIARAGFVSNPGCYPTSAILALAPLLRSGLVGHDPIIINSCSGISGAGRQLSLKTHFPECNESVEVYSVAEHKHTPEIEQELSILAERDVLTTFVPHLVPMNRGILTTACCFMDKVQTTEELIRLYKDFYVESPFVKVLEEGKYPKTKHVLGSNYCHLAVKMDDRTGQAIAMAVIDNLVKGASGQAVQNMNIMCDLDEQQGLKSIALAP